MAEDSEQNSPRPEAEQPFDLAKHVEANKKDPNFVYALPEKLNWVQKKLRKILGESKYVPKEPMVLKESDFDVNKGTSLDQIRQGKYKQALERAEQLEQTGAQLQQQREEVIEIGEYFFDKLFETMI